MLDRNQTPAGDRVSANTNGGNAVTGAGHDTMLSTAGSQRLVRGRCAAEARKCPIRTNGRRDDKPPRGQAASVPARPARF
ncbi:hypothetical protein [uncultured Thiohalocapsa sp.]|uniref:hypothetical protein n=1 Tax=uncultured Thiohalocapsa sp. TaxID=768990 RepID=UPI0025DCF73C|nr:hypothetical protein [uncultured Thiohalocapsa sp.]